MGLEAEYGYTPRVYRKLVHAATQGGSFANGAEILAEQAELTIGVKRLWRAVQRIGAERLAEEEAAARAYEELPLPAQQQSPVDQVPQVACVQMDGGRLQIRDRHATPPERGTDASHWREMKAGVLVSLQSQVAAEDPCPELPASFADPGKLREMAREIKGFTTAAEPAAQAESAPDEPREPAQDRPGRPQPLVRSVVAGVDSVDEFGPRLAAAAYARGFHAAARKAFVADGSEANWGVHARWFSPKARSQTAGVPITAPTGTTPPLSPFASVMMSGTTPVCSAPNIFPVRPKPVCTSSKISRLRGVL